MRAAKLFSFTHNHFVPFQMPPIFWRLLYLIANILIAMVSIEIHESYSYWSCCLFCTNIVSMKQVSQTEAAECRRWCNRKKLHKSQLSDKNRFSQMCRCCVFAERYKAVLFPWMTPLVQIEEPQITTKRRLSCPIRNEYWQSDLSF